MRFAMELALVRNSEVTARRESTVLLLIWRFSRHFKAFNRSPLICPDNKGRRDKLFRKWSINTIPCQYSSLFSLRKTINTTNKSSFCLAHGRRNWQLSGAVILVAKMFFYSPWQSKWHITFCYICRNWATPGQIMEKEYPQILFFFRQWNHVRPKLVLKNGSVFLVSYTKMFAILRGMTYGQPAS